MLSIYVFSMVVGGALLVFSVIGHGDSHGGDVGHDIGHGYNPMQFLSLRTLTYFMSVFGGVGATLTWTWKGAAPIVLLIAMVAGLGVGALASAAFQYLRKTDAGERDSEDSFVGLTGRVTLPIAPDGMGKVLVNRGDRTYELLARPHDSTAKASSTWKSVVVVEMSRGTALVAPVDPALQINPN